MTNATKSKAAARARGRAPERRSGIPLFPLLVVAVVGLGVVAIVISQTGGDTDPAAESPAGVAEVRAVTVSGEALAPFGGDAANDPAIGTVAPDIGGQSFSGAPVTIGADGRAKVIAFVAHWCPHCQAEVPRIADWLDSHDLPEGVDLYLVSTRVSRNSGNYPPSAWLEREGLGAVPTVADDADGSAFLAYGAGGFPYMVFLDADHRVALRTSGEYGDDPEVYTGMVDALAAGSRPQDPRLASR